MVFPPQAALVGMKNYGIRSGIFLLKAGHLA
jgi:hypothetical protein